MRIKNPSDIGKEFELYVENFLSDDNAKRSRSSGASLAYPIDIVSDHLVIECEATANKSYSLKKEFWEEVRGKAYDGKMPILAVRFRNDPEYRSYNLVVIDLNNFEELLKGYYGNIQQANE